jgi:tetratricopeptide (TPR) repeat protein
VKRLARKNLAIAHINCGMAFFDNRRYDLAEKHYINALLLGPINPDFHYHYGLLLHISKRYLDAERHYKEAIGADPKHIKALNNCALVLQELNLIDMRRLRSFTKRFYGKTPNSLKPTSTMVFFSTMMQGTGRLRSNTSWH